VQAAVIVAHPEVGCCGNDVWQSPQGTLWFPDRIGKQDSCCAKLTASHRSVSWQSSHERPKPHALWDIPVVSVRW
jgi:hypothetical protein